MATPSSAADEITGLLRLHWFRQMLGRFPVGRLLDLGAGHGKFARIAADAGWTVTALDARGDRYPDDPRIAWLIGDVREFGLDGFDVIACLGLFYHLTIADQLDLLGRSAGTPIILDTHVANDEPTPVRLTARVSLNGYFGRLYKEPAQAAISTAAWGNENSFWPDLRSLYRMLDEHGYDALTATPWYLPSRTFFLCLPRGSNGIGAHPPDEKSNTSAVGCEEHAIEGERPPHDQSRMSGLFGTDVVPLVYTSDWLNGRPELRAAIDEAKAEAQRQRDRVRAVQRRLEKSQARVVRLREKLDETRASRRWRVGGNFTRPASAIRRRIWR